MIGINDLLKEVDQEFCSVWSHGDCAVCDIHEDRDGLCAGYSTKPNPYHVPKFKAPESTDHVADNVKTAELVPDIKLTLIDVEHKTQRTVKLEETKTWDWGNPDQMRLVGDWQIKNYETLLFILREKKAKGIDEVTMYESPRCILFAGG